MARWQASLTRCFRVVHPPAALPPRAPQPGRGQRVPRRCRPPLPATIAARPSCPPPRAHRRTLPCRAALVLAAAARSHSWAPPAALHAPVALSNGSAPRVVGVSQQVVETLCQTKRSGKTLHPVLTGGASCAIRGFSTARTRSLSSVMPRSFVDVDCHTHPRMNTALKKMFALRQTRDLQLAALKDTSPGHRDILKAAGTFGNRRLSSIEVPYETAPEFRHLGEGVRLTTLVDYDKGGSFLDRDFVGLEVPGRVGVFSLCL